MPDGERPAVSLFTGGDAGFGHSLAQPGVNGYHWAIGFDCRPHGKAVVAPAPVIVTATNAFRGEVTAAFDWANASEHPILILGAGYYSYAEHWRLENGTLTREEQNANWQPVTSGCLYRYDQEGGIDAHEQMAFFCHGSGGTAYLSRRKKDQTIDRGPTLSHDVVGDQIAVIGGDLWLSQGYKVAKCTTDADPGLAASYVTWIPVGIPFYPVNKMLPLGGAMMAVTGAGVYRYVEGDQVNQFENVTPFINPHPDNGKAAMVDGRGRLYYDTADGHILVMSVGYQSNQTPLRLDHVIDRDTPWGPIAAFVADIDHIYLATQPGMKRTQQLGLKVFGYINGTGYVDETANITTQDWSKSLDADDYNAPGDYIYIGADEPFWGIYFELNTADTVATVWKTAAYSTSTAWVGLTDERDGTEGGALDGLLTIAMTGHTDIPHLTTNPWAKQTVNGVSKYWIRIAVAGDDSLIHAIHLCPYRPPLDPDNAPLTGPMMAGVVPTILVGTWEDEQLKYDQVWALDAARIDQLVVSRTPSAESTSGRTLYAVSEGGIWYVPIGPDANPATSLWPKLADYGDSTVAMDEHVLAFSGNNFEMPEWTKRVMGDVVFDFPHVQLDDTVCVWYWWDDDAAEVYRETELDDLVLHGLKGEGRVLYMVVSFEDGSRDAIAPYLATATIVEGGWEPVERYYRRRQDIASPMNR